MKTIIISHIRTFSQGEGEDDLTALRPAIHGSGIAHPIWHMRIRAKGAFVFGAGRATGESRDQRLGQSEGTDPDRQEKLLRGLV